MCGIAGLLGSGSLDDANSMAKAIGHRGPDGSGDYQTDVEQGKGVVAFSHARLSIIDLEDSPQPINSDHGCVLMVNGEIYNHQQIKSNLQNYSFRTRGDSETILALHRKFAWNKSSEHNPAEKHVEWVSKLDGMWGFSLWDPSAEELILCRDPFGIKPLVRTQLSDGTLLFGSEVKAFRGHPEFVAAPDISALAVRLAYEYPLDQTTLFSGVTSVGIGTVETWSIIEGKAKLTGVARYWKPQVCSTDDWSPSASASPLLESLSLSVQDRLMSDVPVGIVLSGGLDSSLMAALAHDAADSAGKPVPECWTVADSEDNVDFQASIMVAQNQDLGHHVHLMNENTMWRELPRFVWNGEDLDITVMFWQSVFEQMRGKVTVALCGQGADELHAGYSRYRDLPSHSALIQNRLQLNDSISISSDDRGLGKSWNSESILPEDNLNDLRTALEFEQSRGQMSNFQLRLGDRHSMAQALEARVPFLGMKHANLANRLPMSWRLSADDEKMALRAAADLTSLPKEIVRRPKLPAGTATSPNLVSEVIDELSDRAKDWAKEYGSLSKQLLDQPDMAIGMRIFHAMHLTESGPNPRKGDLLDVVDDVGPWPQ
ncbi:MAG: asparagine synthase (glutamine-hydrolyzing) [Candidatus Thermoplasmatota archaeon]|nr:asparagine synthase (glutamine-hydrolyzing) [Candidatus Thermoplasmatota archaeon]MED6312891.1 asparagine synthase (glutamine-hydrolyzing) [Candidatus Thermoplasmatota archaeon]MEE3201452.1 asparagine synthase (glutamine-hydrolyzing) [Candidatus Thermoplasmatota archaeon]